MTDHSQIRVLVVDDEQSIRRSLVGFLEDYEFNVASASSAEEALEILKKESFHVGVIDLRLPGMSGDALILKAHEIVPTMRFLIHTGSSSFNLPDELKYIGLRQNDVFLKPLSDMTVVVDSIERIIKRKKEGHSHAG
jgi:DNA-binding NtrC family response regulator